MAAQIPYSVKKICCEMRAAGKSNREIYETYFLPNTDSKQSFESFRASIKRWRNRHFADLETLEAGTYDGFTAHDATVQVNANGEIVQAWIKQKADLFDTNAFIEAVKEHVDKYIYEPNVKMDADRMLEIPLFDMHWGISFMDDYKDVLNDVLNIIHSRHWDEVIIPFGQDFFHNDSIVNAVTTKGTAIEKVDMVRAVKEGRLFITTIIDHALANANKVRVLYTPGNHDRSVTWLFMQVLLERYGSEIVDDELRYRKTFTYGKNSIMVTHGDSKQATAKNLSQIFAISFPNEFAQATVREVHSGHLHHEKEGDVFGVMIRRLSSGVAVDDWSNRQDYVGTHRRFMIFEWDRNALRSIHYV